MSSHISIDSVLTAAGEREQFIVLQLDFIDTFHCAWSINEKEKYGKLISLSCICPADQQPFLW